ncbi:lipid IV(A) 3-deoxy-D-manno-octulosonic acid transferase [Vibrio metschnikovii]|uniref:lipid IV(A) 3-deoxy-D-manno-octulosonic acid transferase n=1 Tax=Vibrio metschnikovii TaxID=28172 RepID=UPI001C2FD622|nr:lipid IV(A) 3-deoxy-D-manno-octulosonic acid transferase [Vibrio metschnikovii]EKO3779818.1 lipid IV(A) 3-deoxy-D-manno-octulosonic acid transferase [Vibrio metschnikovii]EKO3886880.1 lipid IV(A) 3-deoxy-D-manno-octulosonic acid transferase [Vibrio metschnikovii]EKO3935892.1 lipid IV(A) 3-deoxy-D-manno-octulosonic acid transferase [Vibrio metschnikovii]
MLIRWLYSALLLLAAPFMLRSLYKSKLGKPPFGSRWPEHFGRTPKLNDAGNPIWIHAVSVGESIAATPIIHAIKQRNPQQSIIVTTTTSTGAQQIAKLGNLVEHRYMPLDFSYCVRRFLNVVQPSQLLIIETELWPNTLRCVAQRSIPITIINARLSERSCRRYQRFQVVFEQLASHITRLLCQYPSDAERFLRLGVAKEKVMVTGSIKFDLNINHEVIQAGEQLRQQLGPHRPIWIAASTHKGEDELCLDAHRQVLRSYPDALLILVPRHPERFDSVAELCLSQGFTLSRRTQHTKTCTQVYLGDTMGEMLTLIGSADICFMAGSLLGNKVGGHNPLEPAALAKPILNGPSYYNFSEVTEALLAANALHLCASPQEIAHTLIELFSHPDVAREKGQQAEQVVSNNRGALERTLTAIFS